MAHGSAMWQCYKSRTAMPGLARSALQERGKTKAGGRASDRRGHLLAPGTRPHGAGRTEPFWPRSCLSWQGLMKVMRAPPGERAAMRTVDGVAVPGPVCEPLSQALRHHQCRGGCRGCPSAAYHCSSCAYCSSQTWQCHLPSPMVRAPLQDSLPNMLAPATSLSP